MSNRACDAYDRGIKPLSQITISEMRQAGWAGTKKQAVALAKAGEWSPIEWHHSSAWYNKVNFYDAADLADLEPVEEKSTPKCDDIRVAGSYASFGGSRRRPQYLGEIEFTGVLREGWIHLDGSNRKKKAGGGYIKFTETASG
jgi:hypothetical protein